MDTSQQLQFSFTFSDIDIFDADQEEAYKNNIINWVQRKCLSKYFRMTLLATRKVMPSITSSYSNMPTGNVVGSQTEEAAIRNTIAQDWLNQFHEALSQLPPLQQKIIEKKYLEYMTDDGSYPADVDVYTELGLGKTAYYKYKKQALYLLGLILSQGMVR